ncbi:MAG: large conductance mechanosensitive channel protein MscL [Bacilli bacterium]|nr:large conductance mechanosensitive channel protein MscL [Bacilli bacterium]
MFAEFKKFITRGNVVDLAVGVIIGGAFTGIVNGLSNYILKPLINWVLALCIGKDGLSGAITMLSPAYLTDGSGNLTTEYDLANSIYIDWGSFISAIINFFIIAVVLFAIVKTLNTVKETSEKATLTAQERTRERKLAKLIKKNEKLKKKGKPEIAIPAELLPPVPEEEPEPEPEPVDPTVELLTEIRDLLKTKK